MKKYLIFSLILIVVLIIHFVLLDIFVLRKKGNGKSAQESPVEEALTELPRKGDADEGGKCLLDKPAQNPQRPHPALGKPLTYKKAVFGNIQELPDSKNATTGIFVGLDTRQVIWAKNPRKPVPVASMSKMMTALLAFEDIARRNDISLDTPVKVSKNAMEIGGSQIYLDVKETFSLGELLKTLMIVSANDSAQLIAEFLGNGDSMVFVDGMNKRAKELRLSSTRFFNAHGLPGKTAAENNFSCCESLVFLAERLLEYPKAVEWASTRLDSTRKNTNKPFQLRNHNRLVGSCPGVNGMKTGYIKSSGFCITITCERNGRRVVAGVTGFPTRKERDIFAAKLLDWGYSRLNPPDSGIIPK